MADERVDACEGKYTVILRRDGSAQALRYGEWWPAYGDTLDDNLVLALARDLIDARNALVEIAQYQRGGVIRVGTPEGDRDEMIGLARRTLDDARVAWRKKIE